MRHGKKPGHPEPQAKDLLFAVHRHKGEKAKAGPLAQALLLRSG